MSTRRYFHAGDRLNPPLVMVDGRTCVRVPPALADRYHVGMDSFARTEYRPAGHGAVVLALPEVGFFVCERDGFVDIPSSVPVDAVKAATNGHLIPEDEMPYDDDIEIDDTPQDAA